MTIAFLFLIGLLLSALFSGSETGLYRVTRVRLLLDSLGGDSVARGLLWLTNNPALFVATTLVGNNLANYLTSLAVVMAAQHVAHVYTHWVEILGPIILSPVVFVYGELLPKHLFFSAPNRLLRRLGPVLLAFTVLFAPIAFILWILGRGLEALVGAAPLRTHGALARKELQKVLEEGSEAGLLRPAQRALAQSLFAMAPKPILNFCRPIARVASVRRGDSKRDVFRIARRQGVSVLPVREPESRELMGYVRIVDLHLSESETLDEVRPLIRVPGHESHIATLIGLQTNREELACVTDDRGRPVGLLYADELTDRLFRGT